MILEKIHIIITLLAMLVMTIVSIIFPVDLYTLCLRLIVTIVGFYLIGLLAKRILTRINKEVEAKEKAKGENIDDTSTEDLERPEPNHEDQPKSEKEEETNGTL